jgi:hypothetical protein
MTGTTFNRADLQKIPGMSLKVIQALESLQAKAVYAASTVTSNAEATTELQDATNVTLSANAALPNERILAVGANGLSLTDNGPGSTVVIAMIYPIATNGYALTLNMIADSAPTLPIGGTIPSSAIGPYADDAAAAAAGVAVGEWYAKTGGTVAWRVS